VRNNTLAAATSQRLMAGARFFSSRNWQVNRIENASVSRFSTGNE